MSRVWVALTEPRATELVEEIQDALAGVRVDKFPILDIQGTGEPPPRIAADLTIFLSAHAVARAQAWRPAGQVIAIGPATKAALAAIGCEAVIPDDGSYNSEGVVELVRSRFSDTKKILLVCGEGGRGVITAALDAANFEVVEWRVYRRFAFAEMRTKELSADDWIVLGSVDAATYLQRKLSTSRGSVLESINLAVPSERIARACRRLGFRAVRLSASLRGNDVGSLLRTEMANS